MTIINFKNIIITIVKANKKYYKLYKTLDLFLIYCIILTMIKKNETLRNINSAAAQLSSAQLRFKLFKILCLLINYKNYYIYFKFIFDKIVYSYFYIQNIFGKNKNKYHCMILVICYNI